MLILGKTEEDSGQKEGVDPRLQTWDPNPRLDLGPGRRLDSHRTKKIPGDLMLSLWTPYILSRGTGAEAEPGEGVTQQPPLWGGVVPEGQRDGQALEAWGLSHCGWHNSTHTATRTLPASSARVPEHARQEEGAGAEVLPVERRPRPLCTAHSGLSSLSASTSHPSCSFLSQPPPNYSDFSHQRSVPSSSEITPSLLPLEPETREVAHWPGLTQSPRPGPVSQHPETLFPVPSQHPETLFPAPSCWSGCCPVLGQ